MFSDAKEFPPQKCFVFKPSRHIKDNGVTEKNGNLKNSFEFSMIFKKWLPVLKHMKLTQI